MTSRQRGATWVLVLVLAGRLLDGLDLPFERQSAGLADLHGADSALALQPAVVEVQASLPDSAPAATDGKATEAEPIPVNSASVRELQTLPRVGPVLAARIVAWRQANGPFRSLTDLKRVPGIGGRTAARLAPLVRFDEQP